MSYDKLNSSSHLFWGLFYYLCIFYYITSKIKTLGESDSDEDAATWVRKNRMKQREKDRAEKTVCLSLK
jgi:hypothetical protein